MDSCNPAQDSSPLSLPDPPGFFVTVDAETAVIVDGIHVLSHIRDEVEATTGIKIPIVWFVRFQRETEEYLHFDTPLHFRKEPRRLYDGYELAKPQLLAFQERGDEIGWHYHAYNYVYRSDMDHHSKVAIMNTDLQCCAGLLRKKHPEFDIQSFRFGWFFTPDYSAFDVLKSAGIRNDASINPASTGKQLKSFDCVYAVPVTEAPRMVNGILFVPLRRALYIHDYNVIAHDIGWSKLDKDAAQDAAHAFRAKLLGLAADLIGAGESFLTYRDIQATYHVSLR